MDVKEITVLVEAWQMQCCGTAFNIGNKIEWDVVPWTFDIPPVVGLTPIDYLYDSHNDGDGNLLKITGIVTEIHLMYEIYELDTNKNVQKPVSGKLIKCNREADGWHKNMEEYIFTAYLVKLIHTSFN
jgi:hypothetical protein